LRRFDRDVLAQPGVTHAIVMLGTNDLRNRWAKPEEEVTAAQMIAGLKQMAVRAHIRGIKLIGAPLTPFGNETYKVGLEPDERKASSRRQRLALRERRVRRCCEFRSRLSRPRAPNPDAADLRLR
jgi:lysophospholipase L1-like esterase